MHSSLKNDNGGAPRKKCTGNEDDCGPFCGLVQMAPDKSCIRSRLHSPQNSGIPMQATSKNDSLVKFIEPLSNGRYWAKGACGVVALPFCCSKFVNLVQHGAEVFFAEFVNEEDLASYLVERSPDNKTPAAVRDPKTIMEVT